ncbi:MAG: hypothetical protein KDC67_15370 [Ignavibacteriae bacterium]|nr:hypothetical protein [Ignavibacteriota bacterium]
MTYLMFGNHFCGVEHTSNQEGDVIFGTVLKRSKKELHVASSFEVKSMEEVLHELSKNQHITLVVNNDKVLVKTVESEQKEASKLVYKAFPNINIEEFYYEILSQGNTHFISLCRKVYINKIIENYAQLKLSVINMTLGNSLIGTLTSFINEADVYSSNAKILLDNNQIVQIEKGAKHDEYNINGLKVSSYHLLSFSGALQSVLNNSETQTNFFKEKQQLNDTFKQTRFFNVFLKFGGVFILGLLLVNFFFFNHYFNKVNELKQRSEINQSTKAQILKLDETVSKKQKMVDDLLRSSGSKSSFYSNAIMQSLANTILLSEFNYQPLVKRIKEGEGIVLEEHSIIVSGQSNESASFSNWIAQLETEDWIKKIDIVDYGAVDSNASEFKIKILLVDE